MKRAEWICVVRKRTKGKEGKKVIRKRIFAVFVCLCMLMALVPSMAYADGTIYTGGLCVHHTAHNDTCGYSEGAAEVPCGHAHTEDCYTLVTNCVHAHTAECYSDDSTEPDLCGHVCSEESGCITKELNCKHEHDASCGCVPAKEGTPCAYVCDICNAQGSVDTEAPSDVQPEECTCEELCTEDSFNVDCSICSSGGADLSLCRGEAPALCICDIICVEGAVNMDCPVCSEKEANLTICKGEAPMLMSSRAAHSNHPPLWCHL